MQRMLTLLHHRGPDDTGSYRDENVTLGSVRLSIIDVPTGRQPMSNEDGSLQIVFNGEIYNYVELRPELEHRGHRFRTASDTEVLLHAYEEFGTDALQSLNGQFAFAIWDAREQALTLGRDRMGVRPLFYARVKDEFVFASEVKALFAFPGMERRLSPTVLQEVFQYWSALPGHNIFEGVQEVRAGHWLRYRNGEIEERRYWAMQFRHGGESELSSTEKIEQETDKLSGLLEDATAIRLRSDVPVGAYLSGGLDSSLLCSLIARRSSTPLNTFSITFEDGTFDESAAQAQTAQLLGTRHEIAHITHRDLADSLPNVIWHAETPILRTAPAPMLRLSQLARECGFKVVIAGEGADEVLAGYEIFKEAAIRRFWARQPQSKVRPMLLRRLYPDIETLQRSGAAGLAGFFGNGLDDVNAPEYSHSIRWRNGARCRRFLSEDCPPPAPETPEDFPAWTPLGRAQYLEASLFLPQYLLSSQGDRMSMANSIEMRHPYLDYRLVEFANQLPADLKLRGLRDKYLLRCVAERVLPAEIAHRPKRAYRAPIQKSIFCNPAPSYVNELLSQRAIASTGYFRPDAVRLLVAKALRGAVLSESDNMALIGVLSTQVLHHQYVASGTFQ